MSNVVQFKIPEYKSPTASGDAICIQCKHEWIAAAPAGEVNIECPNCHTLKGLLKMPFHLNEGELYRICNCGNDLFRLTPEGHMCINCGIYQEY